MNNRKVLKHRALESTCKKLTCVAFIASKAIVRFKVASESLIITSAITSHAISIVFFVIIEVLSLLFCRTLCREMPPSI